jgi:hypothetical protein
MGATAVVGYFNFFFVYCISLLSSYFFSSELYLLPLNSVRISFYMFIPVCINSYRSSEDVAGRSQCRTYEQATDIDVFTFSDIKQ